MASLEAEELKFSDGKKLEVEIFMTVVKASDSGTFEMERGYVPLNPVLVSKYKNSYLKMPIMATGIGILCEGHGKAAFSEAGESKSSEEDLKAFLFSSGIPLPNDTSGIPLSNNTSGILGKGHDVAANSFFVKAGEKNSSDELMKADPGILHHMILMVALMVLRGMFYLAFSGAKYRATWLHRNAVVQHKRFDEIYRTYSRSHFAKAFELTALLLVCQIYGATGQNINTWLLFSFAAWSLVIFLLLWPFLFNPGAFEWPMIADEWENFKEWMDNYSFSASISWEFWWDEEQEQHPHGFFRWLCKIFSSFRFVVYRYGLMYLLHLANNDQKIIGYGLAWSWLVIIAAMVVLKILSVIMEKKWHIDPNLAILKLLLLFVVFGTVIFLMVLPFTRVTVDDVFSCLLSFSATGWALVQMGLAWGPVVKCLGMWELVKGLARGYEYLIGFLARIPVTLLACNPYVAELQRMELLLQHRCKDDGSLASA